MGVKIRVIEIEATGEEAAGVFRQVSGLLGYAEPRAEPAALPGPKVEPARETAPTPARGEPRQAKTPSRTPPKVASTPAANVSNGAGINWQKYDIRTATRELSPCVVCKQQIKGGERYHDGGYDGRRAHVLCCVPVDNRGAQAA